MEATSGNTGIGLTMVGRQRGYQVKIVVFDRSVQEKTDILRAYGAEVITASSAVPRQHPDHLFNVARRRRRQPVLRGEHRPLPPSGNGDTWPESFQADVVDWFERVSDRESLASVRRLAREDGLLAGSSSGTAVAAALRVARKLGPADLVVVLPDSGRSYLSTGSFSAPRLTAELAAGRIQSDDPISGYADPPPPTIGSGQSVDDALQALGQAGDGPDMVLVLRDGRASAVLTRAALLGAADRARPRL